MSKNDSSNNFSSAKMAAKMSLVNSGKFQRRQGSSSSDGVLNNNLGLDGLGSALSQGGLVDSTSSSIVLAAAGVKGVENNFKHVSETTSVLLSGFSLESLGLFKQLAEGQVKTVVSSVTGGNKGNSGRGR